jgi:hypothetical protein
MTNRTTSVPQGLSFSSSTLDSLKGNFSSGSNISHASITTLLGYAMELNSHYHTVDDQEWAAYGNKSTYSTTTNSDNTAGPSGTQGISDTDRTVGELVKDDEVDHLRALVNALQSHTHNIYDSIL